MAYFLKKSKLKKGLYLQIYESFYDPDRKQTAHRSYQALGYLDELIAQGIPDPLSYYAHEVSRLNENVKKEKLSQKSRKTSDTPPDKFLGYFLLKSLHDALCVEKCLDLLQKSSHFDFSIYQVLSSLMYAYTVMDASQTWSFQETLSQLFDIPQFSQSQLEMTLDFLGEKHQEILAIYKHQLHKVYTPKFSETYCFLTNFYCGSPVAPTKVAGSSEIDLSTESDLDSILALDLGLLLDANQVPIHMSLSSRILDEISRMPEVMQTLKLEAMQTLEEAAQGQAITTLFTDSNLPISGSEFGKTQSHIVSIQDFFQRTQSLLDVDLPYLQKKRAMTGLFLVSYLAFLILQLLQHKVLATPNSFDDLLSFIHDFRVIQVSDHKYINMVENHDFIRVLSEQMGLPLTSYFLTTSEIKKILNYQFCLEEN